MIHDDHSHNKIVPKRKFIIITNMMIIFTTKLSKRKLHYHDGHRC